MRFDARTPTATRQAGERGGLLREPPREVTDHRRGRRDDDAEHARAKACLLEADREPRRRSARAERDHHHVGLRQLPGAHLRGELRGGVDEAE